MNKDKSLTKKCSDYLSLSLFLNYQRKPFYDSMTWSTGDSSAGGWGGNQFLKIKTAAVGPLSCAVQKTKWMEQTRLGFKRKRIVSYFKLLETTQNIWIPQLMFHKVTQHERGQGRAGTHVIFWGLGLSRWGLILFTVTQIHIKSYTVINTL